MASLEYPCQDIEDTAPLSPTGILLQKATHEDMESKQIYLIIINKQKEPPKMRRQRNPQSKGKEESPERVLSETEASNLSDIEFKVIIIRMLKELSENYKELSGNYIRMKKDIKSMNKNQEEVKDTITEMKYALEGIKSKLDEAHAQISGLEVKLEKKKRTSQSNKTKNTKKEGI